MLLFSHLSCKRVLHQKQQMLATQGPRAEPPLSLSLRSAVSKTKNKCPIVVSFLPLIQYTAHHGESGNRKPEAVFAVLYCKQTLVKKQRSFFFYTHSCEVLRIKLTGNAEVVIGQRLSYVFERQ